MKSFLWSFFLIFTLWNVSVAEESYCEISEYFNKCSYGDIILLEKDYINSLSLEKQIAKYCSFDHQIIELTDKYLNNPKFLCIFKEQI